jgi:hypothetical protein
MFNIFRSYDGNEKKGNIYALITYESYRSYVLGYNRILLGGKGSTIFHN